ncbi:MAG: transcription-repair coupling factor [Firmicutes bacterium]|nr:transcription-repair coupling factor [Bacillota bacterium]
MRSLMDRIGAIEDLLEMASEFRQGHAHQALTGVQGSARHLIYGWLRQTGFTLLVTAHSMQAAEVIRADLAEFLPQEEIYLFPERELSHSDLLAFSPELAALRLGTLTALQEGRAGVVVTTIRALHQDLPAPAAFAATPLRVRLGDELTLDTVASRLVAGGYERSELVETRGQFSIRGGLFDVYPMAGSPIRVELFDVEVDSIRYFDAETQRSLEKLKEVTIWPAREIFATTVELAAAADRLDTLLRQQELRVGAVEIRERLLAHVGRDIERMRSGTHFPGLLRYARLLGQKPASLLSFVAPDAIVVYDEPSRLRETMERVAREESEWVAAALEHGEIVPGLIGEIDVDHIFAAPGRKQLFVSLFARAVQGVTLARNANLSVRTMQQFHGQLPLLKTELARYQKAQQQVVLLASSEERAERLASVLHDFGMTAVRRDVFDATCQEPQLLIGNLEGGFEMPAAHLVLITEGEVFVTKRRARKVRADASEAARIKSWQDLNVGDYVVHVSHGIGKYMGIETLIIDGNHRDYLNLKYAGNDKLFVPVDQINLVQKYLGSEDREPRVHHLGGSDWTRAKQKVQKSVQDIAEDLIKIYAARETTPGHAFRPDSEWQRGFEGMFPYEETPDQLRAIRDIKADLERPRPMDRLLCGDVGYGKTEVAIRAAAKAVFEGKQVAVLVPTTILAQQHFQTFRERFAGYPVTVEVLSRFRSKADTERVMKGLKAGTVEIVIGTHRLLQKSIDFKDLGLLVVDEEQRFGVTHKEKLKSLRASVDCLTLTATPIPRTLHMSMVGVRDLSVIETPPENRFPVQTYVVEYSDGLLREAIEREIGRGGQVYVLYNQVKGIQSTADRVAKLVPEARVAVGHGQMPEDELERVMLGFLQGETDVLVSTTIIETGLDIPNVNTLLVFNADRMGLSQLYQLRGRVGRSNRIAYAYFTYQPDKVLTEVAEKRLQAIKEFTELGSGFKIAMRDLAIRGAGNLLGAEQHGFISSVGFDLYSEMLAQAVRELKGEAVEQRPEPSVEITVDAYLSDDYVRDPLQKIEMYKKFVAASSPSDVDDLREELEDRFGEIPAEAYNLLRVARVRAHAVVADIASVSRQGTAIHISFRKEQQAMLSGQRLFELTHLFPRRTGLKSAAGVYTLTIEGRGLPDDQLLDMTIRVMAELPSVFLKQEALQHVK